jgi:hypothetical protein
MAVYTTTVTVATTAATTTLTSWAPYVAITVPSAAAGPVFVSTSGTAVTTGVDSVSCAAGATTYIRNRTARPELTTTTPAVTDPSAVTTLPSASTAISTVAAASTAGVVLTLAVNAGTAAILG